MPSINVNKKDLELLVGKKFSDNDLNSVFEFVKGEVDGLEDGIINIDVKETNRPDLWSTEGIARELRARLNISSGLPSYEVKSSGVKVFIDKNLEKIRPFIVCAIIKDVSITDEFLVQLIQLQEKIGGSFGRKRKELGIGLYDFDKMKAPIYYKGFKDSDISFIPLDWKVSLSPKEILVEHDKGKQYAHLLNEVPVFPIVIDSNNVVASMPPIINSEITGKISSSTKNIFLEITGSNWIKLNSALNVFCMALADRGGKIFSTEINMPSSSTYPSSVAVTPSFGTKKISVSLKTILDYSGLSLSISEISSLLSRARYNIISFDESKKVFNLEYADYRLDIFHPVDVVEDILISYGYNNIGPVKLDLAVVGSELPEVQFFNSVRDVCVGLSLQEVLTFNLTSKEIQMDFINSTDSAFVELGNPMSSNWAILRKRLFPELLNFLAKNKSNSFPQKIFEIGTVLSLDDSTENGVHQSTNLCVVISHSDTNFTEIKSHLCSLLSQLGLSFSLSKISHPAFSENVAQIIINGRPGIIGEISPKTLSNFGLNKPVTIFEFELF